jgi:hypothetical protein
MPDLTPHGSKASASPTNYRMPRSADPLYTAAGSFPRALQSAAAKTDTPQQTANNRGRQTKGELNVAEDRDWLVGVPCPGLRGVPKATSRIAWDSLQPQRKNIAFRLRHAD